MKTQTGIKNTEEHTLAQNNLQMSVYICLQLTITNYNYIPTYSMTEQLIET